MSSDADDAGASGDAPSIVFPPLTDPRPDLPFYIRESVLEPLETPLGPLCVSVGQWPQAVLHGATDPHYFGNIFIKNPETGYFVSYHITLPVDEPTCLDWFACPDLDTTIEFTTLVILRIVAGADPDYFDAAYGGIVDAWRGGVEALRAYIAAAPLSA